MAEIEEIWKSYFCLEIECRWTVTRAMPSAFPAPSPGWGPRGQGPSKNRQGRGKNNWTYHVPSGLPDKNFGIFRHFLVLKIEKDQMTTPYSMEAGVDGWVTLTLIPPVTRLKCIVWVLSLFLGSIDARTWRRYRLCGPRPPDGPHWQFQSGDGAGPFLSQWQFPMNLASVSGLYSFFDTTRVLSVNCVVTRSNRSLFLKHCHVSYSSWSACVHSVTLALI